MTDTTTDSPHDQHSLTAVLATIAAALSDELDLDRILHQVSDAAREITGAQFAALGVVDAQSGTLVRFIHSGIDADQAKRIGPLPTGGGLLGELIRNPTPLVVDDLPSHAAFQGFPKEHPRMKTFLGVPVRAGGQVLGNLYVSDGSKPFDDADLHNVLILASQAGLALRAATMANQLQVAAVQDERARISRDLHDGVIQSLFSIGMGLESVARIFDQPVPDVAAAVSRRLEAAIDQLDATIREIRGTIFTLRPQSAEGLTEGLLQLAREYEVNEILRPSLDVAVGIDSEVDDALLPDVLHVVREALSNVARHAQASHVSIRASAVGADLVVSVRDEGRGFDVSAVEAGRGLGNMAERAVLLAADLRVESDANGTTVALTVPLQLADDDNADARRTT